MKHCLFALFFTGLLLSCPLPSYAKTVEYTITIARNPVNITGKTIDKITVNGSIPGPTLQFTEGDDAVIHLVNKLDEDTSIHWHGLLLPDGMDGVPGLGGFPGVKPGETFTYRFKIRQNGTYWYHAHSLGQEQEGHYGSIIIKSQNEPEEKVDRDYVVLISDYSDEESTDIMANLKMSPDYYQFNRRTVGDFFSDARGKGFTQAWKESAEWGDMRMLRTDLSDVTGYTFLMNGKTPDQNWTGLFKKGERVRLRFINASAMSFYDVRIPGLKMSVVSSDGQKVEPVTVDEFRFGAAETYDVIVEPDEDRAYTIVAEPIDRTGFAIGTLAPRAGMKGDAPEQRPRAQLTMADMSGMHSQDATTDMPHHSMHHVKESDYDTGVPGSGWAQLGTPEGMKSLTYKDLRFLGVQKDSRPPEREVTIRLGGNMERYIWTMNGKKFSETGPINLSFGERIRIKFINETMMAHPMHLHGMFVQLENGQPTGKLPNKHTVIVAPGDAYSVLLTADEPGEWAIHCHLLYHMMSGMMNKVVVAKLDKPPSMQRPSMEHTAPKHSEEMAPEHGGHYGH